MASLLFAAGILSYDQIKKQKAKHAAKKAHNASRFSELERDNAARISALQDTTCFCQRSDWQGGACEVHGYVPKAGTPGGPPGYSEREGAGGVGEMRERRRGEDPPEYRDGSEPQEAVEDKRALVADDGAAFTTPHSMQEDEIRRINEERRKGKGGIGGWKLKRKRNKEEGIVR